MRAIWVSFALRLMVILVALSGTAQAAVLLWSIDARSGSAEIAEGSDWAQYIQSAGQSSGLLIDNASVAGAAASDPQLLVAADLALIRALLAARGDQAGVWVKLGSAGIDWVFISAQGQERLQTAASSDGLELGASWIRMQIDQSLQSGVSQGTAVSALMPTLGPIPERSGYQHPGETLRVAGVVDSADYLRLTQSLRQLPGVRYLFPARIDAVGVELIIGTDMDRYTLDSLLAQQPWLRPDSQGGYRWDALAARVPGTGQAGVTE